MDDTKYERVSETEIPVGNAGLSELEREILEDRKRTHEREGFRNKVEGFLWMLVSIGILWYGNGRKDFVSVVATDERIAR